MNELCLLNINRLQDDKENSISGPSRARRFVYRGLMRRRQLQLRIMWLLLAAAVSVTALMLSAGIRSLAADKDMEVRYKYYTSIDVPFGDTFESVADRYYDADNYSDEESFKEEVRRINRLGSAQEAEANVRPGDSLIIPYYSAEFK